MRDGQQRLSLGLPSRQGLYDPALEKDACGVGFVCDIKGRASRSILDTAEHMNCRMVHRGGLGCEKNTGDGAGVLTVLPHQFLGRVDASCSMVGAAKATRKLWRNSGHRRWFRRKAIARSLGTSTREITGFATKWSACLRVLKGFRRIFTRYDKLDVVFVSFIYLALVVDALR